MSDTRYIAAGDHSIVTAKGGNYAPGESIPATAVDVKSDHDKHLIADGQIIDTKEQSR